MCCLDLLLSQKLNKFVSLQMFEPPLDMSQDIDICEHELQSDVSDSHLLPGQRNLGPSELPSEDGRVPLLKTDGPNLGDVICRFPKVITMNEL